MRSRGWRRFRENICREFSDGSMVFGAGVLGAGVLDVWFLGVRFFVKRFVVLDQLLFETLKDLSARAY